MPVQARRQHVADLAERGAQLLEVLPVEEYRWAHLPGAINIPLRELDDRCDQLERSRPVVVYCNDTL